MLLWFVGLAVVIVWQVFRDPALDHRAVIGGVLLPDVVDGLWGGARLLHTVVASVATLAVVMLATRGRRTLRRRLLALPIGMFLHLVLDGMWATARVFWWPFLGWGLGGRGLPSLEHPVAVTILEEIAGAVAIGWVWVRFGLADRERRWRFLRGGKLEPC